MKRDWNLLLAGRISSRVAQLVLIRHPSYDNGNYLIVLDYQQHPIGSQQ